MSPEPTEIVVDPEPVSGEQAPEREVRRAARREPPLTGPLLAVAGLCGGAGATTLAYLVGASQAERSERPVLVCDASGPTAGTGAYAGVASRSLPEAALTLAAGLPLDGLFAESRPGLHVMAGRPVLGEDVDEAATARLLADARLAHALTVVDCGVLANRAARIALAAASHVAWVLPATRSGLARADRLLELLLPQDGAEVLVARAEVGDRGAPLDELAAMAEARRAPLVLMPHVPDLAEQPVENALAAAAVTLEGLNGVLGR